MINFKNDIHIWIVNRNKINIGSEKQILNIILRKYNITIKNFGHRKTGKPYLKEQNTKISISRSKELVAFALSYKDEIGLDIEKIHSLDDIKNFSNFIFMNKHVINIIECHRFRQVYTFFKYWTLYEAYAKLTGEGLISVLQDKKISESDIEKNFIKTFQIEPNCVGTIICGKNKPVDIFKL